MLALRLLAGFLLLVLCRRLFWLFVGLVGFAVGLSLTPTLFPGASEAVTLILALILAVIGAILAVFLQRIAIAVAGLFAGAFLGSTLASAVVGDSTAIFWVGVIAGGILGAILLSTLFDWGLIALSSLVGATMVVESLNLSPEASLTLTIVLFLVGLAFQMFTGKKAEPA